MHVAYYRVSTQSQNESGLGLEAQQAAVLRFCGSLIAEFTEIESGRNSARPELAKAIALCKKTGATLVVARMDRLSRKVSFISALQDSGIDFLACDNPNATRLTIHILAAVAEAEAAAISERTRLALQAARQRGTRLGNPAIAQAAEAGRQANSEAAREHAQAALPLAKRLRARGKTLAEIANRLSDSGILTRRGKRWSSTGVARLLGV